MMKKKDSAVTEAENFFLKFRDYYENLLQRFPERRKARWWHILFRIDPRGMMYEEFVRNSILALSALKKGDIDTVVNVLDELICWYKKEYCLFSESVFEMGTNFDIQETVRSMEFLKASLLELGSPMKMV